MGSSSIHQLQSCFLKKKNSRNNYIDDPEDIKQELQMSMLRAGSYYKRQVYIEKCFAALKRYVQDDFIEKIKRACKDIGLMCSSNYKSIFTSQ